MRWNYAFTFTWEMQQINALALILMLVQYTQARELHLSGPCACIEFVHFTWKGNMQLLNFNSPSNLAWNPFRLCNMHVKFTTEAWRYNDFMRKYSRAISQLKSLTPSYLNFMTYPFGWNFNFCLKLEENCVPSIFLLKRNDCLVDCNIKIFGLNNM